AVQWEHYQLIESKLAPLATLLYASAFALGMSFATLYDILDIGDYLAVPIFMWCVLAGVGLAALASVASGSVGRFIRSPRAGVATQGVVLAAVLLLAAWAASRSLHRQDLVVDHSGLDRRG